MRIGLLIIGMMVTLASYGDTIKVSSSLAELKEKRNGTTSETFSIIQAAYDKDTNNILIANDF